MPVSVGSDTASENRLLAALPKDDYERRLPHLANVSFTLGEVVYEFGGQLDYVYFPTTAIVSLLYTMENGSRAEMGLTGNDVVVGGSLSLWRWHNAQSGRRTERGWSREDEGQGSSR